MSDTVLTSALVSAHYSTMLDQADVPVSDETALKMRALLTRLEASTATIRAQVDLSDLSDLPMPNH